MAKKPRYNWGYFREVMADLYPAVTVPPAGNVAQMLAVLSANNIPVSKICNHIRQLVRGNAVWLIYRAKEDGWWQGNASADIRKAPGSKRRTIGKAKKKGWYMEPPTP